MIKLFWNTHNQNKPNPNKSNEENNRDKIWGIYHKDYSDKWIYEILNKIEFYLEFYKSIYLNCPCDKGPICNLWLLWCLSHLVLAYFGCEYSRII